MFPITCLTPHQPHKFHVVDVTIAIFISNLQKHVILRAMYVTLYNDVFLQAGLHKLCHPAIRDGSTLSKFGARGEHGDVFLFSNLGALWFSENLIRYSLNVCLREVKNNLFSFKHSYLRHFS